jgi:type IX secretion system PorP/SprF family membrane protein
MKKLLCLVFLLPFVIYSQQESYYSLYNYNMQVINPAYAGAEADLLFSFINRSQWESLDDSPKTMAFSLSSKRKNNIGLGLSVVSDKVFVEKQTFAYLDFSYLLDMGKTKIFLGLKGGGNFYRASSLDLEDYNLTIDPAQGELSRFNPNVGAGLYIKNKIYWFSVSIPRLFNVKRNDDLSLGAKDRVHSYVGGGFDLPISKSLTFKPMIMLRKVKSLPLSKDIGGFLSILNKFDIGISHRSNSSFSAMTMVKISKHLDIGYAYESPINNSLLNQSIKTNEFFLRIKLNKAEKKDLPKKAIE